MAQTPTTSDTDAAPRAARKRPGIAADALQTLSIPGAFVLGAAQLANPLVLALLVKSAAISVAILAGILWAGFAGFAAAFEWMAGGESELMRAVGQLVAVLAAILSAWLLWRLVAMTVLQFFADDVVAIVEARHYPDFTPRNVPLAEEIAMAGRSLVRVVLVNAVALPVALALVITGVGTAVLFGAVNAWLLGLDLQNMVWARHPESDASAPDRQGTGIAPLAAGTCFLLGLVVVLLLLVPVVNLLAPFLGAAAATHLVHRSAARRSMQD